jgi:hypothetical protein
MRAVVKQHSLRCCYWQVFHVKHFLSMLLAMSAIADYSRALGNKALN